MLGITDHGAPASPRAFVSRREVPDKKGDWVPLIWGPSYTTGLSVSGRLDWLDYAAEIKNASLSSRPDAWEPTNVSFERPTVTGRLGVRPGPEWAFGASFSEGPCLLGDPLGPLPAETSLSDFDQTTFGVDAAYQHHHLQLWAESFHSRFEVPRAGGAGITADHVEAKYKLTARWWAALRWNQSFSGQVPDGLGGETDWDRDAWRADLSVGCRLTEHAQAKIQYSHGDQSGDDPEGDRLLATQLTIRF